jgi:hypothetical protein
MLFSGGRDGTLVGQTDQANTANLTLPPWAKTPYTWFFGSLLAGL